MSAPRASTRPRPGSPPLPTAEPFGSDPARPTVVDGVAVLHWPAEADARVRLAADDVPRILVVDDDAPPPLVWGRHEDWVREGAARVELEARTARLAARPAPAAPAAPMAPVLDADGILRTGDGRWAMIPPVEARLLAPLLDHPGRVVHRPDLQRTGWPGGGVGDRAVDGRIKLLRRRVADLGITIHTVRGVGYLLELG